MVELLYGDVRHPPWWLDFSLLFSAISSSSEEGRKSLESLHFYWESAIGPNEQSLSLQII